MKFTTVLWTLPLFAFAGVTAAQTEPPPEAKRELQPCPEAGDSCPSVYLPFICFGCIYTKSCLAVAAGFRIGDCRRCTVADGCPEREDGGKQSSRRRLLASNGRSLKQEDEAYLSFVKACGDHEYDVSLYVDPETHLYVVGEPKNQHSATSTALGCPFGATHAVMSDKAEATKEILVWKDANEGASMFEKEARLHIGTFKLSDMARAYEEANPENSNGSSFYDVVTNNCGAFLANLASELDVKIDSHVTAFVVRRLLENSGKQLADKVRSSLNYFSLFGDRNLRSFKATDEEIVQLLVEKGVSQNKS